MLLNSTVIKDSPDFAWFICFYRRIYPENNEEKYARFFANSCSLFQETAASKARSECARLQREEIRMKTEHIENMRKRNGINKGLGTKSSGLFCGFGGGYLLLLLFLQSCVIRIFGGFNCSSRTSSINLFDVVRKLSD